MIWIMATMDIFWPVCLAIYAIGEFLLLWHFLGDKNLSWDTKEEMMWDLATRIIWPITLGGWAIHDWTASLHKRVWEFKQTPWKSMRDAKIVAENL